MQPIHSPDTSANAMTEVALGLSMAFFSLLIVALLSMTVPVKTDKPINKPPLSKELAKQLEDKKVINVTSNSDKPNNKAVKSVKPPQFAFYFQGKLYDQNLSELIIGNFEQSKRLIIAVNKNIAFDEVYKLRSSIKHPQLSITTLNEEWLTRLNNLH